MTNDGNRPPLGPASAGMLRKLSRRRALRIAFQATCIAVAVSPALAAGDCGSTARQVANKGGDAIDDHLRPDFALVQSPVPASAVAFANWYGNTELAYRCRRSWYGDLQGFHSGLDWAVPVGTEVTNPSNRTAKVISIGSNPYDWGSAPNAVALDCEDSGVLLLVGHLSGVAVALGQDIPPGKPVGFSGIGEGFAHLHLETIRKDPRAAAGEKPGNIRRNPAALLSKDLLVQFTAQVAQAADQNRFHARVDGQWQQPLDQPDINPINGLYFPEPGGDQCPVN